jgi:tetratricopeptide (TPR) repeat protein
MGDRERAMAEYREAVRNSESETDAALRLAELYFETGQFRPAAQFAERHIKNRPYVAPNAHIIAARAEIAQGQYERAEGTLMNLRSKDSASVVPYVEFAALKRAQEGPEAAIASLEDSGLDMTAEKSAPAMRELASNYIAAGRQDDAIALTTKAVKANPQSAEIADIHARALSKVGRREQAMAAADAALAIDPEFAPALETKGRLVRASGDLDGALALFEQASAADPETGEYLYLQAQTHMMKGEQPRGIELLRKTLEVAPGHVGANNDLAWLIASSGKDLDEALVYAKRAVRVDRSADTLDTLGYVHLQKGEAEEAVGVLSKALEERPDSPSIEYRLGLALAAKGDREQARAVLTKALETPAFPEAEAARKELAKLQDS